jgi:hypothetical protein
MERRKVLYDTLKKDGASQNQRELKALEPSYFQPEDRRAEDWLLYARKLARLIRYSDENTSVSTSWESFLDWDHAGLEWEEIVRYVDSAESANPEGEKNEWLSRPHFVLLVAFLKLLQYPKDQINNFTIRHLDFYYEDILRFRELKFIPDKVHLAIGLQEDAERFLLRKGTLLLAGKGPAGDDIHFKATRDTLLNHARITDLKSWFADQETLGIKEMLSRYQDSVEHEFGFWPTLRLVYGEPGPGDPLTELPDKTTAKDFFDRFAGFNEIIASIKEQLGLRTEEFKTLMSIKVQASEQDRASWALADELLSQAGRKKKGVEKFVVTGANRANFDDNLRKAVGTVRLDPAFATLEACYQWMVQTEKYFLLPIEEVGILVLVRNKLTENQELSQDEADQFTDSLERAFQEKRIIQRRAVLRGIRVDQGFDKMITYALGHPNPGDNLPHYRYTLREIYQEVKVLNKNDHVNYLKEELYLNEREFITVMELNEIDATPRQWENGYEILERAMRQKRQIAEEKPVLREWYNLYKSDDATLNTPTATPDRWRPFGNVDYGKKAEIGIAVASPILKLRSGVRTIQVELFFENKGDTWSIISQEIKSKKIPFRFSLSAEKNFFEVPEAAVQLDISERKEGEVTFKIIAATLSLRENDPSIVTTQTDDLRRPTSDPVLKIVLKEKTETSKSRVPYILYKSIRLMKVGLKITAEKIKPKLEDDFGEINPKKPFEPFGTQPMVGSSLFFLEEEIVEKKLDMLSLSFQWMGTPDNFSTYYKNYPKVNKEFTARLFMFERNIKHEITDVKLFAANLPVTINDIFKKRGTPYRAGETETEEAQEISQAARYFSLELNAPDFQHAEYSSVAEQKSIEYSQKLTTTPPPSFDQYQVNPPYTPKLKSFTLTYSSSTEVTFNGKEGAVFYLHPFGVQKLSGGPGVFFLPQYEFQGSLFVGIENFKAPDVLSIFFQLEESSAHPDILKPSVSYHYLTDSGWKLLDDANVLFDSTDNLGHAGILQLSIPEDASDDSLILPGAKHWLKLSVGQHVQAINDFQRVCAGGIEAVMNDDALQYIKLPPEMITATAEDIPEIKSIHQPYGSFGGRSGEDPGKFYTRVSERLRHKQRSLTIWDYERMVLQEFPEVYKVKALPATASEREVKLIVIPDLRNKTGMNPFEPRFSQAYRSSIEQFLHRHSSHYASFRVLNPEYVKVKIRVSVRLKPGFNESYSQQALNLELQKFLSPWAFAGTGDIGFGGTIYANTVVSFLDTYECIDYVLGLKFFTSVDGKDYHYVFPGENNINVVEPPHAESILVSADVHDVDIVRDGRTDFDDLTGIEYMKIELDFKIN